MERRTALAALIEADRAHLIHPLHFPAEHTAPLVAVEAAGAVLRDAEGREDIDGLASLWNVNVGHGRTALADAAAAQMRRMAYTAAYAGFSNEPAVRLAERLIRLAYPNLSGVYFTTGGAESNETAFKIARYYWKRRGQPEKIKIISRIHGYHGVTLGAMSATGMPAFHRMFAPTVPGLSSRRPQTTSRASARSAINLRSFSSPTRSSPDSAGPAAGSPSTTGAYSPTSSRLPRA